MHSVQCIDDSLGPLLTDMQNVLHRLFVKALGRDKPCQCLMTSVTSTPLAFCAQLLFSLDNIHLSTNILHAHAYRYFMYSISILTSSTPCVSIVKQLVLL